MALEAYGSGGPRLIRSTLDASKPCIEFCGKLYSGSTLNMLVDWPPRSKKDMFRSIHMNSLKSRCWTFLNKVTDNIRVTLRSRCEWFHHFIPLLLTPGNFNQYIYSIKKKSMHAFVAPRTQINAIERWSVAHLI